ncbi:MAG: 2-oxoacid:ferredoxin oxidoreductase subunit beta [Dehalococcoidales bacterium]|nr:2-oxoacid:ferredoxin oxidoreductase subunit beta [Dehalococcoidales bacterium]
MEEINKYVGIKPAWCPGCGNFGILRAVQKAIAELDLEPYQVLMVSGIGQAGKLPHYTRSNILNELHGRPIPAAIGAKIANPELVVLAISGDGDAYGEGGNHWLHAMRRNHDITYLVHNNQIYGLTKGQASPSSDYGFVTKTTPEGAPHPLNPIALAIASDVSFVARSFAGDPDHLSSIIKLGIQHKGFALIDILQPCVTFNHKNTYSWYQERIYKLEDGNGYKPDDKIAAFIKAQEWEDRIPIGVFYRKSRPVFEEQLFALKNGPLTKQNINPLQIEQFLSEFA